MGGAMEMNAAAVRSCQSCPSESADGVIPFPDQTREIVQSGTGGAGSPPWFSPSTHRVQVGWVPPHVCPQDPRTFYYVN